MKFTRLYDRKLVVFIAAISILVFVSYWHLLKFDIWQDDNALIFKVQHPHEQVGVFGAGEFGLGAYRYVAYPYILLSKVFGVNLSIFYFTGLVIHIAAVASVFFLSKLLFNKKDIAFLTALLFSISYIGLESLIRLFNSIQTSLSILFISLTFFFLYLYKLKKNVYYLIYSSLFFFLSIEIGYVRMQYSIIPLLTFWLLYFFNASKFSISLITIIPFLGIYIYEYVLNSDSRTSLINIFLGHLGRGNFEYLYSFFASSGYLVIPDLFLNSIYNFSSKIAGSHLMGLYFIEFLVMLVQLIIHYLILWKKDRKYFLIVGLFVLIWAVLHRIFFINLYISNLQGYQGVSLLASFVGGIIIIYSLSFIKYLNFLKDLKKLYIFFWIWVFSNVAVYSVYLPLVPLETTSRYLSHSSAPFTMIVGLIYFSLIKNLRIKFKYSLSVAILINILLSFFYVQNFYINKMLPIKNFYTQLKLFVPNFEKGSVIYFEVADDLISKQQFADFFSVGSMPDTTAIAVRYELDRYDFQITQNFDEFQKIVKNKPDSPAYAFYYGNGYLTDKTTKINELINNNQLGTIDEEIMLTSSLSDKKNGVLVTNEVKMIVGQSQIPVFPVIVKFDARVLLNDFVNRDYPLKITESIDKNELKCTNFFNEKVLKDYYQTLKSKEKISKIMDIRTQSEEKNFNMGKIKDNDTNTVWRGGRGNWIENHYEEISIELSEMIKVYEFDWYNAYPDTTPIKYQIDVSLDGINWTTVMHENTDKKKDSGWINELLNDVSVRFIKFKVSDTYEHDSPAISEIRIIESGIDKVFIDAKINLLEEGYCFESDKTLQLVREENMNILRDFKVTFITTDEIRDYILTKNLDLIVNYEYNQYNFQVDLKGLRIKEIRFGPAQFPADIKIRNIKFTSSIST